MSKINRIIRFANKLNLDFGTIEISNAITLRDECENLRAIRLNIKYNTTLSARSYIGNIHPMFSYVKSDESFNRIKYTSTIFHEIETCAEDNRLIVSLKLIGSVYVRANDSVYLLLAGLDPSVVRMVGLIIEIDSDDYWHILIPKNSHFFSKLKTLNLTESEV